MSQEDMESIEKQLEEIRKRSLFIEKMRKALLLKKPEEDQDLKLIIFEWHHIVEHIFDSILMTYIGAQNLEQEMIDSIPANSSPAEVCKDVLFYFGFDRKMEMIADIFGLSEPTLTLFRTLNKFRNGLAHRYEIGHNYFMWKKKNVLSDGQALEEFIALLAGACDEISRIDNTLAKLLEE